MIKSINYLNSENVRQKYSLQKSGGMRFVTVFTGKKANVTSSAQDYRQYLFDKSVLLGQRIKKLQTFLPDVGNIDSIPNCVTKPGQPIKLKRVGSDKSCTGTIREILPLSAVKEYSKLKTAIDNTWIPYQQKHNPTATILHPLRDAKFDQGMTFLVLEVDGKIQGLAALQADGRRFLIRELNTAPWNQGSSAKIKGVGTALMARLVSACFESNNFPVSLFAVDNPNTINFYKKLGMQPTRIMHYFDKTFHGFRFSKEQAVEFLKKFQKAHL